MLTTEQRASLDYFRVSMRNRISDLEQTLGAEQAFPVTKHALAAMEQARQMEQEGK